MENIALNTSQITHNKGMLYVVAMPLGNDEDLSPRARKILNSIDFILAEDTKRAGIALARLNIAKKDIFLLNDHNEEEKTVLVLEKLRSNAQIALISDAGMPVISDPGYLLISRIREEGLNCTVIPGASAPITALAGSGIPPIPFTFLGFLPRARADQEKTLNPYSTLNSTLIFFERKDRLFSTLELCFAIFGARKATIAREITKIHEEYISFNLNNIEENKEKLSNLLGEITVIIAPPTQSAKSSPEEIDRLIAEQRNNATSPRNLAKRVQALSVGWLVSDIYNRL